MTNETFAELGKIFFVILVVGSSTAFVMFFAWVYDLNRKANKALDDLNFWMDRCREKDMTIDQLREELANELMMRDGK